MLAADDIVLAINGEALCLRPSLRAAVRLERRFGGFKNLLTAIGEGSVSALVALAVECGAPRNQSVVLALSSEPWGTRLVRIKPDLMQLVFDLAEIDPDAPKKRIRPGTPVETVTLAEAYTQLFAAATGVLGWPPAVAWAATPGEIKVALDAYLAMFRAAHGIPAPESPIDDGPLDSAGLAELAEMQQ